MKATKIIDKYLTLVDRKKALEEEIEVMRNLVMDEMQKEKLKQIKTDKYTVSIAKRVSYQVNEPIFRAWAFEHPDFEIDNFYINQLDKKMVADYSQKLLKEDGEVVPFVKPVETEYVSVRAA
jgi:hypothetical protein